MDVYLQPLVDELKELWSGIEVVDKSKRLDRQIVDIRGILMWTMHDYPGYGECSGLVTSGYHACAICGPGLNARYSFALKKMIYQGRRAYLSEAHPGREGFLEHRPLHMTAKDWQLMKQRHHEGLPPGMKRFSILYELPYWTSLRINHLLDPMHIFKNVGSLLWDHITGRKDSHGARTDLQEVGIMKELWPVTRADGRITLPKAPWVLSKAEEHSAKRILRVFCTMGARTCTMSDHSGSGSRSPSLSDAEVSRFLERLTPEQLASVASKAQQSLSEQSSPTQSARSAPSASSSRRSRLSRASGPERGSERVPLHGALDTGRAIGSTSAVSSV
ncbi:hypothetical protein L7F22_017109 [Adiantum nelumboides]|nr:hypothetical protein [Adiantum nelumboides]